MNEKQKGKERRNTHTTRIMSYVKDKSKKTHYSKLGDGDDDDSDSHSSSSSSSNNNNTGMSYSKMLEKEAEGKGYPVKLNVYDLHPFNKYVYWMGLGAFHAGIEVLLRGTFKPYQFLINIRLNSYFIYLSFKIEWTFGYGATDLTGMSINDPRKAPGAVYRETIFLGMCTKSRREIDAIIGRLAKEFPGNSYHMLIHNCVTFCDTMCFELLGTHIPTWINRLPNFAYHIKCCLPKDYRGPFPGVEETPSGNKKREESRPILGAPIAEVMKCQNNYAATQIQDQQEKEQEQQQQQKQQQQQQQQQSQQKPLDDSGYVPPSVVTMDDDDEEDEKKKMKKKGGESGSIIDIDEGGGEEVDEDEDEKDTTPSAIILID